MLLRTHLRDFVTTAITMACLSLATSAFAQPFIGDINRWVAQDALDAPASGAILFTGSSSIRRYEQLALDFADYEIIQRGFGGSQFEDLNSYVNDIVLPYHPSAVVVWEGTNDINSGETGQEVFADYEAFVNLVHTAQPGVEIFWLGITPTPGRLANGPQEIIANNAIAAAAANDPKLHYIDLRTAFDALNPPTDEAFTSLFADSIHLDRQGYELWTSVIRPQIEAVIAPNKTFTPNPDTPQPGSQLLFDFGPSNPEDGDATVGPDTNGRVWNNWHAAEGNVAVNAGEHLGNLVDTAGNSTGIDLTITGGFATNGKLQGGLLNPDSAMLGDLAVATATQDYFFSSADGEPGGGNDDRPGGFMLEGLDPALAYDFRFFGSRNTTQSRDTEYLVTGANSKSGVLQTSGVNIGVDGSYDGNDDEVVTIAGIRPDQFGQVFVDLTVRRGTFAYLNAMEVTVSVPEPTAATGCVLSIFASIASSRHGHTDR